MLTVKIFITHYYHTLFILFLSDKFLEINWYPESQHNYQIIRSYKELAILARSLFYWISVIFNSGTQNVSKTHQKSIKSNLCSCLKACVLHGRPHTQYQNLFSQLDHLGSRNGCRNFCQFHYQNWSDKALSYRQRSFMIYLLVKLHFEYIDADHFTNLEQTIC